MIYLSFIFALALACVAGMEFICLMALETKNRQLKGRVRDLERENEKVRESLRAAETMLEEQRADQELWPDLIDDSSLR